MSITISDFRSFLNFLNLPTVPKKLWKGFEGTPSILIFLWIKLSLADFCLRKFNFQLMFLFRTTDITDILLFNMKSPVCIYFICNYLIYHRILPPKLMSSLYTTLGITYESITDGNVNKEVLIE